MVVKKQKIIKKTSFAKATEGKEKFYEAVGRRKTATARVRIWPNSKNKEVMVNDKNFSDYFKEKNLQETMIKPFEKSGSALLKTSVKVFGGGLRAQAHAIRHGLSRALVLSHPESKSTLKTLGFLTRDSRMKERKKPGLKGARRAPQWSKR